MASELGSRVRSIGRNIMARVSGQQQNRFVAVNDITDAPTPHLLKYDRSLAISIAR